MSARTLVVGGDGFVAGRLLWRLKQLERPVLVTSRRSDSNGFFLDLTDPDTSLFDGRDITTAVILASQTKMQVCQEHPDETWRINVDGTLKVICALAEQGARIIFLSSSQVYGGDVELPDEQTNLNPRNVYGAQKLEVERALASEGITALVFRPPRIVDTCPVGMFVNWLDELRVGRSVVAARNIHLSPGAVSDFVDAMILLDERGATGCYNISSPDQISYFEAAQLMAEQCGLDVTLVQGEDVAEEKVPAIFRPRYTSLDCGKIEREFGLKFPSAREVLERVFSGTPAGGAD